MTGTLVFALVPVVAAGCSDDDDGDTGDDGTGGGGGGGGCDGVESRSSVVAAHSHTVCIDAGDLTDPPTDGMTYTTSSDDGHAHQVVLSETQLTDLAAGTAIIVTTTSVDMHTHEFTLVGPLENDPGSG